MIKLTNEEAHRIASKDGSKSQGSIVNESVGDEEEHQIMVVTLSGKTLMM